MLRPLALLAPAIVALLAAPALATGTVDTFTGAVNGGGWTYGPPPTFPSSGGNPGWWLNAAPDTFAPQLRSTATHGAFVGDWRADDVVSLGVDLITVSTQFPASRPLSVILSNGACRVYTVGSSLVPQPGAGWKSFDFAIDSQSTSMPAGWAVLDGCVGDPDAAWNNVITNVTQVNFFYGDPTFFFIFDIWNVGADNVRIYSDAFTDERNALAGAHGAPVLAGSGALAANTPVSLVLTNALENSSSTLIIGLSALNAPFKGGVLVPQPDLLIFGLPTGGSGTLALSSTWPSGIPSGFSFYFQHWIVDAAGPVGFAASNGVKGTTP